MCLNIYINSLDAFSALEQIPLRKLHVTIHVSHPPVDTYHCLAQPRCLPQLSLPAVTKSALFNTRARTAGSRWPLPRAGGRLRRNKRRRRARGSGRCPPAASRGRQSFTAGPGATRGAHRRPYRHLGAAAGRTWSERQAAAVRCPAPLPAAATIRRLSRCSFLRCF